MGWTAYDRPKGLTDREHLESELMTPPRMILDSATIDNVFYAAVSDDPDDPRAEVWALVVLQHRGRTGGDHFATNYARKEIDETWGPVESKCPDRILDLLTPTEDESARRWRARCREHNRKQAAKPKVRKGDTIKLERELLFGDGVKDDTFTLEDGRRNWWRRRRDAERVRLPARRNMPGYEKV